MANKKIKQSLPKPNSKLPKSVQIDGVAFKPDIKQVERKGSVSSVDALNLLESAFENGVFANR